jgi:hypothetical protein
MKFGAEKSVSRETEKMRGGKFLFHVKQLFANRSNVQVIRMVDEFGKEWNSNLQITRG